MASVALKNLYKNFGQTTVVRNVNVEIDDGEFLVFVGPSGCGKTTTLRMVVGLESISEGEIYIGNNLVNALPPGDRDVAMVFQNYALYSHMTVSEKLLIEFSVLQKCWIWKKCWSANQDSCRGDSASELL